MAHNYFCETCEVLGPCRVEWRWFLRTVEVCNACGSERIAPADGHIARALRKQRRQDEKRAAYKAAGIKHPRY